MGFKAEVPSPIQPYDLFSLAFAKRHMGGYKATGGSTTDDTLIEDLISFVSVFLQRKMSRLFAYAEYSELHDSNGREWVFYIGNPPISSVMPVKVYIGRAGDYTFTDSQLATEHQDYEIYHDAGKIKMTYAPASGLLTNKIVYHGGWEDGTIPEDLKECGALILAKIFKMSDQQRHGLKSISRDGITESMLVSIGVKITPLPPEAKMIIDLYDRKKMVG